MFPYTIVFLAGWILLSSLLLLALFRWPEISFFAIIAIQPFKQWLILHVQLFEYFDPTLLIVVSMVVISAWTLLTTGSTRLRLPMEVLLIQLLLSLLILSSLTWTHAPEYGFYKAIRFSLVNSLVMMAPALLIRTQASLARLSVSVVLLAIIVYSKIWIWPSYAISSLAEDKFFRAGFLYGADAASVALQFASPLLIAAVILARPKSLRFFSIGAVGLLVLGAWNTGTRASVLTILLALVFTLALVGGKRRITYALAATLVGASLFWIASTFAPASSTTRILAGMTGVDASGAARLDHWSSAIHAFWQNPLGGGVGSYAIFDLGRDTRWFPHSIFLETAAELGIPGMVLLFLLFFFFVRYALRARRMLASSRSRARFFADAWLVGSAVSLAVAAVSDDIADNRAVWLGIGVTIAAYQLSLVPGRDRSTRQPGRLFTRRAMTFSESRCSRALTVPAHPLPWQSEHLHPNKAPRTGIPQFQRNFSDNNPSPISPRPS